MTQNQDDYQGDSITMADLNSCGSPSGPSMATKSSLARSVGGAQHGALSSYIPVIPFRRADNYTYIAIALATAIEHKKH